MKLEWKNGDINMPRQIWNEGRVVGYSAYELFVKQLLSKNPNATPPTEKEWLSSMIGMGNALILKITSDNTDGIHYRDFEFPENSNLCGAGIVIGAIFDGKCEVDDNGWGTKVIDYGSLISNTIASNPTDGTLNVKSDIAPPYEKLREYSRIFDGLIIQDGTWSILTADDRNPYSDLSPDLSKNPFLRLGFTSRVKSDFYILLTGLHNRGVIGAVSDTTGSTSSSNPENGDFLGPLVYPWSTKVLFFANIQMMEALMQFRYKRSIKGGEVLYADADGIVDIHHAHTPNTYYDGASGKLFENARIDLDIEELNLIGDSASILSVTSYGSNNYTTPPALYGTRVSSIDSASSDNKLYPIDVVAPGTVKLFNTDDITYDQLINYSVIPYNSVFTMDSDYIIRGYSSESDSEFVLAKSDIETYKYNAETTIYLAAMDTGNKHFKSLSWTDTHGTALPIDGSKGVDDSAQITGYNIIRALQHGISLDVLGEYLRSIRGALSTASRDKTYGIHVDSAGNVSLVEI